jgi:hypothetical protein
VTIALLASVAASQDRQRITVKTPVVTIVGCAMATAEPHVWTLTRAGELTPASTAGITNQEKQELPKRPIGRATYQLIGVADFVDSETAQRIGLRAKLFPPTRMNTTAQLINGHKVAVRGLYIEGKPARVNLTSVLDLSPECER